MHKESQNPVAIHRIWMIYIWSLNRCKKNTNQIYIYWYDWTNACVSHKCADYLIRTCIIMRTFVKWLEYHKEKLWFIYLCIDIYFAFYF